MASKDLITVIMPCYNSRDFLKTSIPSVLNQTNEDFELLLVNDHSTDEYTLDLLHDWVHQDPRIRLISNEVNVGLSQTRNRSIEHVKGKYFTFFDHDDLMRPDFLAKAYEALELTKADFAWFNVKSQVAPDSVGVPCAPDGMFIPQNYFNLATKMTDEIYLLEREPVIHHPQFLFTPIQPMGKVINLRSYQQAKIYFKECYASEDQEWCIRLMCTFPAYALVNSICGDYMLRASSLSHSKGEKVYQGVLDTIQARYELLVEYNMQERLATQHLMYSITFFYFCQSRFEKQQLPRFKKGLFDLLSKQGYSGEMILQALDVFQKCRVKH